MTIDELTELLEGVPSHVHISIAAKLPDGQILHAPVTAVAQMSIRKRPAFMPEGRVWLLAEAPWKTLNLDVWAAKYRVKR